ncbi:MAG: hypothetical protein KDI82_05850 [Gammaproteobacteria bacterium]|nr:hypothetical protein [Gammaproteobacteria bacterium]
MPNNKAVVLGALLISLTINGPALAFNPLESFGQAMQNAVQQSQQRQAAPQQQAAATPPGDLGIAMAGKRQVVYEGYSKDMLPVKKLLADGQAAQAYQTALPQGKSLEELDMLGSLEAGTLAIDAGMLEQAKVGFQKAEMSLDQKDGRSTVGGFFSGTKDTLLSTLTGNAELGEYQGAGYERVLMLNYKSIAHLLDGERAAYNVTRRAIDLQNIEKKKFDELVREAREKIAKEEAEQKSKGADLGSYGLADVVEEQYQSTERQALKVPHAFVNPFGFYIAGVVQELDSYEDKSLRDNARISYNKALELNPKSDVIKQAAADMRKPAASNKRLVNVIIADGFAPEKKLLKFDLSLGASLPTVIELPVYEPVDSRVARVEIQTTGGKRWSRASEVADISALALRFQKDAGPIQQLRMMTTVVRNVIEGQAWNNAQEKAGVFGSVFGKLKEARDELAHPDMRSWTTLPSRLLAARFFVPTSVSRIKIVAFDSRGRQVASELVDIDKDSHNVVYARVIDNKIYASSSKKMWVKS